MTYRRGIAWLIGLLVAGGITAVVLLTLRQSPAQPTGPVRVGYTKTPLLAPLFAAKGDITLRPVVTTGGIGYALISGDIDAGFIEPVKAAKLLATPAGRNLKVVGAIQFPYGATVVLRQDLTARLTDLASRKVAVSSPHCALTTQFLKDGHRLGLATNAVQLKTLPFDAMLPALEAKAVDAVVVKGSHAVLAERQGHKVLYQNWDMKPGDECCPAIVAQLEFVLVAQRPVPELVAALLAANDQSAADLRRATVRQLAYPETALADFPVASFAVVDEKLLRHFHDHAGAAHP